MSGIRELPSPRLIAQIRGVHRLTAAGAKHREIAEAMHVSGPRISQLKQRIPELTDYLGDPHPTIRLANRRVQLDRLRAEVLDLLQAIKRDLVELDEELSAASVDLLLGLREG